MDLVCPYCSDVVEERAEGIYQCVHCGRRAVIRFEQDGEVFLRRPSRMWLWAITPWMLVLLVIAYLLSGSEAALGIGVLVALVEWPASVIWVAVRARHLDARVVWSRALLVFFVGGALRAGVAFSVAMALVAAAG